MPRASLPPTPAASTKIEGKDVSPGSATENFSNLPPPAIESHRSNGASALPKISLSISSPAFSLPPPPTRSRTIIQMKPKPQSSEDSARNHTQQGSRGSHKKPSSSSSAPATAGKKQPSSTSVAGKRIARKTAHSVIERRRRSKMNEEFGTLKAMIPACTDQEMHKLAILQVRDTIVVKSSASLLIPWLGQYRLPSLFGEMHRRSQSRQHFSVVSACTTSCASASIRFRHAKRER